MASKAVYARLETGVYDQVRSHAEATGQSVSSSVEDLIERGLGQLSSEGKTGAAEKELVELRERTQQLEKDKVVLQGSIEGLKGRLEACRTNQRLALQAQSHVATLQAELSVQQNQVELLRGHLLSPLANCGQCGHQLRLFDYGQHKCPSCGQWRTPKWLPQYEPTPNVWEAVREPLAAVGTVAIVAAILGALGGSGGSDKNQ